MTDDLFSILSNPHGLSTRGLAAALASSTCRSMEPLDLLVSTTAVPGMQWLLPPLAGSYRLAVHFAALSGGDDKRGSAAIMLGGTVRSEDDARHLRAVAATLGDLLAQPLQSLT
jgi:hypothetical protein